MIGVHLVDSPTSDFYLCNADLVLKVRLSQRLLERCCGVWLL